MPTPNQSIPTTSPATPLNTTASQRVLACVLCQQRKVKCNRDFPCANCVRARVPCVPASLAQRQRRRRFPERELLDRLRHYENLLCQNNITFEPLHKDHSSGAGRDLPQAVGGGGYDSADEDRQPTAAASVANRSPSVSTTVKSEPAYEAKNFWDAMNQRSRDSDDDDDNDFSHDALRPAVVNKVWDQLYESNDHLFFGSSKPNVELSALHPSQVQIFRLWHIYLDNVNPLLKVTHTPTLQGRIIDAASNIDTITPILEALMFSIYCVAVMSLIEGECQSVFGLSRDDILTRYQLGCQQALRNCGFLRSGDRECLTALYLYLVSIRPSIDPRSLSSLLGVALRLAQRVGIDNESKNARCTAFEAEMRRRLWWSLILFDTRICELANYAPNMMSPTWDCMIPLNVSDFDLRPEMTKLPVVQGNLTDSLFAVVRSELAEFVRHRPFHLDFTNPALKNLAKDTQSGTVPEGGEVGTLERTIEDKYIESSNPENPLHYMTIWTARAYLARNHLLEHYARYSRSPEQQTDAQRDAAISHALSMLECDTKLIASSLTKGYLWLIHFHFPFVAYIHIVQDLRKRPVAGHVESTWEAMNDNFAARFSFMGESGNPLFNVYTKPILQAWEACEAASIASGIPLKVPRLVLDIRNKMGRQTPDSGNKGVGLGDFSMPTMDFGGNDWTYGMDAQSYVEAGPGISLNLAGHAAMDADVNQLNWAAMEWYEMHGRRW